MFSLNIAFLQLYFYFSYNSSNTPSNQTIQGSETDKIFDQTILEEFDTHNNDPLPCGRRIVDMKYFFSALKKFNHHKLFGCSFENINIINECRVGLISKFLLKCDVCQKSCTVATDDYENEEQMDINKSIVMGIINSGGSYTQLQTILTSINMPNMSSVLFYKTQDLLIPHIHDTAWKLMEEAGREEAK